MQKRLIQATAAALLFVSLSAPAYANGNGREGHEKENRGRGYGLSIGKWLKEIKADWKDIRIRKEDQSDCLKAAQQAHESALQAVRGGRDAARESAGLAFHTALRTARDVSEKARTAARDAFLASDKGEAAQAAYAAAKDKAETERWAAYEVALKTWFSAKIAAQKNWEAAKAKADVDFKTAREKCAIVTPPSADIIAPAVITNLSLSGATANSFVLSWTAPGDDGASGTAAGYDIRYSTSPIASDAAFAAAVQVAGEPAPAVAGTTQTMTVSGLVSGTTYYFVMKSQDEAVNISIPSNSVSLSTL